MTPTNPTAVEKRDRVLEQKMLFAAHYAAGEIPAEAVRLAGFTVKQRGAKGAALLEDPIVQDELDRIRGQHSEEIVEKAQRIDDRLWEIANTDVRDMVEWTKGGVATMKASNNIPPALASRIQEIDVRKDGAFKVRLSPITPVLTEISRRKRALDGGPAQECLSLVLAEAMKKANERTLPELEVKATFDESHEFFKKVARKNTAIHQEARDQNNGAK